MGKSTWLWVGLAVAAAAVIYYKRCEIPFIKNYLCKGGKEAPSVPQLVGSPDITQAVMSPTSADPAAMAEMKARMTP